MFERNVSHSLPPFPSSQPFPLGHSPAALRLRRTILSWLTTMTTDNRRQTTILSWPYDLDFDLDHDRPPARSSCFLTRFSFSFFGLGGRRVD